MSASSIYALFKSKEGLLQAFMGEALFNPRFSDVRAYVDGATDPVEAIALTAQIARVIYDNEHAKLKVFRDASAFSPALKQLEQKFETIRMEMQRARIEALVAAKQIRIGLSAEKARHIMWMFTSRDVYRMLVLESGWASHAYQEWLAEILVGALVEKPRTEDGCHDPR